MSEEIDDIQKKDYLISLRVFWTLFGVLLPSGAALFVLGIITTLTTDKIASGVLGIVGGSLLFLVSFVCLAWAILSTSNYEKAKRHIPRTPFDDPGV